MADFAGVNREPGLLALLLQAFVVYMETVFQAVAAESAQQGRLVRAVGLVDAAGCAPAAPPRNAGRRIVVR